MRTKVKNTMTISGWDEANDALRQIGENDRDILAAENVMNEQIANAKAAADAKSSGLRENSKMLAQALKEFATLHRSDMGKLKSRKLMFGTLSFRQSTKVILPRGADEIQDVIDRLHAEGMKDCVIHQPDKVDKNALRKYSDDKILSVGATVKVSETFGYEVDAEKIETL